MTEILCANFNELCHEDIPLAGGKGANLGEMVQAGLPVPPGFVICAPAYRLMLKKTTIINQINQILNKFPNREPSDLVKAEEQIRPIIENAEIPPELAREIIANYHKLGTDVPVAVRSSATAEDLAGASFAGQQETFLNVIGDEALLKSTLKCWSSLFTSQAMFYRAQKGFKDTEVSMAVVIQIMVNSEKSGVTFTYDPVTRNPYQMTVEGVWGLGEGIVSGTITPDHYKIDRETKEVIFEFKAPKTIMFTKQLNGGIYTIDVPPEKKQEPVLSREELISIVELGNVVESHFGSAQDIEWGIEDGHLYLLQSRPVTNI